MRTLLLTTTAIAALAMGSAQAGLISIGLQQAGVNGGLITTETTGNGTANMGATAYGTFTLNLATAVDQALLGGNGILNTNVQNITSSAAGVLNVFITSQNLHSLPMLDGFLSSFALNDVHPGIVSVTESTFFSLVNGLYTNIGPDTLDSHTFTSIGVEPDFFSSRTTLLPFSVTEEYTITAQAMACGGAGQPACGNDNATIDMSAVVPEPGPLAVLLTSLLGLAWLRRRHR